MVRRWLLHISAWPLVFLIFAIASVANGSDDASYEARVYGSRHFSYLYFRGFDPEHVYRAHKKITLDLHFAKKFDSKRLSFSVNGLAFRGSEKQLIRSAKWSETSRGHQLRLEIGPMKFGPNKRFHRLVRDIYHYHGWLRIWVKAPERVDSAALVFGRGKVRPPRTYLDSVQPYSPVLRVRDIRFQFHGSEGASEFQCRLNKLQRGWTPCESPVVYRDLTNGKYRFRVRAVGADGRPGRVVRYKFEVRAPLPGVKVTRVLPEEKVTSERNISIHFEKLGKYKKFARTYCRVDRQAFRWCQSPVRYENLSVGEHAVEIRRTHWIYTYRWARWLAGYKWFRHWLPVHTAPVVYRWTISDNKPTVAWVTTPAETTASGVAGFEFKGTGADRYTCALNGSAPSACEEQVQFEVEEGNHELTVVGYAGDVASQPLQYRWTVDQTGPVVSLESVNPEGIVVAVQELAVSVSTNEPASLRCALDGADLGRCETSFVLTDLTEGAHVLQVVGTDAVGNEGQPLEYAWDVDLTAPEVTLQASFPETFPTAETRADFIVVASPGSSLACSLDGAPLAPCPDPVSYTDLGEGAHDLKVVATDTAGNSSDATFSWQVDRSAPVVTLGQAIPPEKETLSTSLELPFAVSEAGSVTCELDLGGQVPCVSPYVINGLAEGPHKVEVVAVDLAGNVGVGSYEWTIKVDASVQLVSVDPTHSPTAQTAARFEFNSNNASSFLCALDGASASACVSPVAYSDLAEGNHTFEVWGVNSLGESGASQLHQWTVDTTGPEVVLGQVVPPGDTTATEISVTFSSEADARFFCTLDGGEEVDCVSPLTHTGLGQGSHTVTVVAEDAVGNRGAVVSHSWVIDIPAPPAVIDTTVPAESLTNSTDMNIAFSAAGADSFECRLDGANFGVCTSPQSYSGLGEGQHVFEVRGLNSLGESGAVASHTWVVDTQGPDVTLVSVDPAGDTAETAIRIEFGAEAGASFFCTLDGGSEAPCASPFTQSGLGQGAHQFSVVAEDALGNRGAAATHGWVVDVPPPLAQIDSVSPSEALTQQTSMQVAFSGAPSFECRLDGGAWSGCASPQSYSSLGEGAHVFEVRGLNAFNEAGPAVAHNWTVDTQGPVVVLLAVDPSGLSAQTSFSASFSSEAGASFFCTLDGGAEAPCASPYSAADLGQGSHSFSVVAQDSLGNRGTAVTHSWTVDVPPPVVQFDSVTPGAAVVASTSLSASFSGAGAASFECRLDGAAFTACASPFAVTGLGEGAHVLEVRGLNAFGEASNVVSHAWTVDTVAPVLQIDSVVPAASPTTDTHLELAFSANEGTFQCELNGGGLTPCTSPVGVDVAVGAHLLRVVATDGAGNSSQVSYNWEVELPPLTLSGAMVRDIESTSAMVDWQTNLPSSGQLIYGEGSALDTTTPVNPALITSHGVSLTNLKPFTLYSVQAVSVDEAGREVRSEVLTFRTQF